MANLGLGFPINAVIKKFRNCCLQLAGANRLRRLPFRCRGSSRESPVVQLSTLGYFPIVALNCSKSHSEIADDTFGVFGLRPFIVGLYVASWFVPGTQLARAVAALCFVSLC